jgi:3-oxoacyl-[acyl-carrier-protein] synthase-3
VTRGWTEVRGIGPLALSAAAAAYPSDLAGASARFDTERAYHTLMGPRWRESQGGAERDPLHIARAYGVEVREWCLGTDVTGAHLATEVARRALDRAGWHVRDLGLLAVATSTPQSATKCLAAAVADALGATCGAIDVRGGGAGGLDAWVTAALYAQAGAGRVLAVAVETTSLWLAASTGTSALLFGDGAGALALEPLRDMRAGCPIGLVYAAQGSAPTVGRAFTVPGALPPRAGDPLHFQAPDDEYQSAIATVATDVARRLAGEACAGDTFLPYAVKRDQVQAAGAAVGADTAFALDHLRRRGALGCAGPLAAIAERLDEPSLARPSAILSLAVGGGVRWTALRWQLGGLT